MKEKNIKQYYQNKTKNISNEDLSRLNMLRNEVLSKKDSSRKIEFRHYAYSLALVCSLFIMIGFPSQEINDTNLAFNNIKSETAMNIASVNSSSVNSSYLISDVDFTDLFDVSSNESELIDVLF